MTIHIGDCDSKSTAAGELRRRNLLPNQRGETAIGRIGGLAGEVPEIEGGTLISDTGTGRAKKKGAEEDEEEDEAA